MIYLLTAISSSHSARRNLSTEGENDACLFRDCHDFRGSWASRKKSQGPSGAAMIVVATCDLRRSNCEAIYLQERLKIFFFLSLSSLKFGDGINMLLNVLIDTRLRCLCCLEKMQKSIKIYQARRKKSESESDRLGRHTRRAALTRHLVPRILVRLRDGIEMSD